MKKVCEHRVLRWLTANDRKKYSYCSTSPELLLNGHLGDNLFVVSLSLSSLLGTGRELRPWESGCFGDRRKWLLQRGGHHEEIGCNNYTTGFFLQGGGGTFLIISNTVKIYQLNRDQQHVAQIRFGDFLQYKMDFGIHCSSVAG